MVDLDLNLDLAADAAEPSELSALLVVVGRLHLGVLHGQLHLRDDQVVLLVRGVRAQDHPVLGVLLALRLRHLFVFRGDFVVFFAQVSFGGLYDNPFLI